MGKIDYMIKDQRNYKRIDISNYYSSNEDFIKDSVIYKGNHVSNPRLLKDLQTLLDTVAETNEDKIFYLDKEIESHNKYPYELQALILEYLNDKESALENAYKYGKTYTNFMRAIEYFDKKYSNHGVYDEILLEMADYIKKRTNDYEIRTTDLLTYKKDLINAVYASGLSMVDYSFYNLLDNKMFNSYTEKDLRRIDKEKYEIIEQRENKTEGIIKIILEEISNGNIDVFEYYTVCKLHPIYLGRMCSKLGFRNDKTKVFTKTITTSSTTTLEKALKVKTIISGIEITDEIKGMAFKYLEECNVPSNEAAYSALIRRLIK